MCIASSLEFALNPLPPAPHKNLVSIFALCQRPCNPLLALIEHVESNVEAHHNSAVKEQALHFLANFKQGNRLAQDYFSLLELWFAHAELTDEDQKYHFTENGISSQIRDWLAIIGFPKSYQALKDKMTQIDDNRRQQ